MSVYHKREITKVRSLKKSALFHKSATLFASFESKRRFLWHPTEWTKRAQNVALNNVAIFCVEIFQLFGRDLRENMSSMCRTPSRHNYELANYSQQRRKILKKSAFFLKSTTLSATFDTKRTLLWKSLNLKNHW